MRAETETQEMQESEKKNERMRVLDRKKKAK